MDLSRPMKELPFVVREMDLSRPMYFLPVVGRQMDLSRPITFYTCRSDQFHTFTAHLNSSID